MRWSRAFRHGGSTEASDKPMDRSPKPYARESLRKMILKHEEIFKHQVTELHRLYGVQKMLMAELRINKFSISASTSGTSQSSYLYKDYHSPVRLNTGSSSQQQCNHKKSRQKSREEDKDLSADGDSEINLTLSIGR